MKISPLSSSRALPFRNASASSGRSYLTEKLACRPAVAKLAALSNARAEEQDAMLNGMTRSLHRRLSGLNLPIAI